MRPVSDTGLSPAQWTQEHTATLNARLLLHSTIDSKTFSETITPTALPMHGVRIPVLQKLAKEIAHGDWRGYLAQVEMDSFEQAVIRALLLGRIKVPVEERLAMIAEFVPAIDNWAVCDSLCSGLRHARLPLGQVWPFLEAYLDSDLEFYQRFGAVMLLCHFVEDDFIDRVLARYCRSSYPGYYARMGVAWGLSVCYIKYPAHTLAAMDAGTLDTATYNLALRKMRESLRVSPADKELLKAKKRV